MANTRAIEDSSMVSLRLSKSLLEKIERFMKRFTKENAGLTLSRADAIRMLISKGLERGEDLE